MAGYKKFVKTYGLSNISAACLGGRTEDVESALKQCRDPANVTADTIYDESGWSPIHFACRKDHEAVVGLLLNSGFSPLVRTPEGNTPLHIASRNGCGNVVRELLEVAQESEALLECKNKEGNTPLHLACEAGQLEVVQKLVEGTHRKQLLSRSNGVGITPLGLAIQGSQWGIARLILERSSCTNPALTFDDFTQHVPACSMIHSLDNESLQVIITGDVNTGKSTLIKSLQTQGTVSRIVNSLFGIHNADQHKVGIVPSTTEYSIQNSKHQVIFHDLTGHRDYTHEAIFECTNKPLDSLFIVTVDMRCSDEAIEESISYWLTFLWQKCNRLGLGTGSSQRRPNVLVVGSFADQRLRRPNPHDRLNLICRSVAETRGGVYSHFSWLGNYTFDCQRPLSWAINQLRSILEDKCQQLQQKEHSMQPGCYILATLLETELASTPAIAFDALWTHIVNSDSPTCKLLPQNTDELLQLCKVLRDNTSIVLLPKSESSDSYQVWIVRNYREVVIDIHDILLESDLRNTASNGIVTCQSIEGAVPHQSQYPSNFIIQFLDHFKFCKRFDADCLQGSIQASRRNLMQHSKSVPAMSNSPQTTPTPHRTISQPSPVTRDPPPDLFFPCFTPQSTPEPWESNGHYTYSFAWVSMPCEDQECPFFMPGFVTRFLVHLIQMFAPSPLHSSSPIERKCTVWSQGVCWSDAEGIDACVAVHNNRAVTLSMRCLRAKEMACLELRNKVIHEIRYIQQEAHLDIKTNEYITGGDILPLLDPNIVQALYSMGEILEAVKEDRSTVLDTNGRNPQELDTLLYFEPYAILSDPLRKQLLHPEKANERLTDDFCMQFAQQLGSKWQDLAHYYKLPEAYISDLQEERAAYRTAMELLQNLRDARDCVRIQTYGELCHSFECISIFKSRDVLYM